MTYFIRLDYMKKTIRKNNFEKGVSLKSSILTIFSLRFNLTKILSVYLCSLKLKINISFYTRLAHEQTTTIIYDSITKL